MCPQTHTHIHTHTCIQSHATPTSIHVYTHRHIPHMPVYTYIHIHTHTQRIYSDIDVQIYLESVNNNNKKKKELFHGRNAELSHSLSSRVQVRFAEGLCYKTVSSMQETLPSIITKTISFGVKNKTVAIIYITTYWEPETTKLSKVCSWLFGGLCYIRRGVGPLFSRVCWDNYPVERIKEMLLYYLIPWGSWDTNHVENWPKSGKKLQG